MLRTESDSQFPPANQPLRMVPTATDEDEAQRDQGADPQDPTATRTGQEGAPTGSGRLLGGARDPRDLRVYKPSHQPLNPPGSSNLYDNKHQV